MNHTAIVVLAGGRATRFPGKLEARFDGEPMLERVCRRLGDAGLPLYVAGSPPFVPAGTPPGCIGRLNDRWPGGGPLRALHSAFEVIDYRRVFLIAGDEPNVDIDLLRLLDDAWSPRIDAVVPRHGTAIEPLAALYGRRAALAGAAVGIAAGHEAMHDLIARLRTVFIGASASYFTNVNTVAELTMATKASR